MLRSSSRSLGFFVGGISLFGRVATFAAAPPRTAAPTAPDSARAAPPPFTRCSAGAKRAIVTGGPPPAIMKLADVRPGMVGEALTVFSGT